LSPSGLPAGTPSSESSQRALVPRCQPPSPSPAPAQGRSAPARRGSDGGAGAAAGWADEIFGWSYVIMPKLKGQQFNHKMEEVLPRADRTAIAQALGENLILLHALTWDYAGKYSEDFDAIQPFSIPFGDWVIQRINDFLDTCSTYNNKTTEKDKQWVQEIISDGRKALEISFIPSFIMQDYQITNVTLDKLDEKWEVTGVFDFMENYFGDNEVDFSRTFANYAEQGDEELASAFVHAYFAKKKAREGFEKRFPIYMIMDRLIVWEWAQRTQNMWWDTELTFRQWCNKFISLDNVFVTEQ
jgi:hygromycin-B 7''-O-kinase